MGFAAVADNRGTSRTQVLGPTGAEDVPLVVAAERVGGTYRSLAGLIVTSRSLVARATVAGARAALVGFSGADAVPGHFAAERIHGANARLHVGVVATQAAVGNAAGALSLTPTAILRTRSAIFIAEALPVPAPRGGAAANHAPVDGFRGAEAIPGRLAAVGIVLTHHAFATCFVAAGPVMGFTTVARTLTAAEFLHLPGTLAIPGRFAAERVHVAHTILDLRIVATRAAVGNATGALSLTPPAILRAGSTVFVAEANAVPAPGGGAAAHHAPVIGLVGAGAIPGGLAAVRIVFAYHALACCFVAPRLAVCFAAVTRALTTAELLDAASTDLVPCHFAAIRVHITHALFNGFVVATGSAVVIAAISDAGATIVGFSSADAVPCRLAAERVRGAHTILYVWLVATRATVGNAA